MRSVSQHSRMPLSSVEMASRQICTLWKGCDRHWWQTLHPKLRLDFSKTDCLCFCWGKDLQSQGEREDTNISPFRTWEKTLSVGSFFLSPHPSLPRGQVLDTIPSSWLVIVTVFKFHLQVFNRLITHRQVVHLQCIVSSLKRKCSVSIRTHSVRDTFLHWGLPGAVVLGTQMLLCYMLLLLWLCCVETPSFQFSTTFNMSCPTASICHSLKHAVLLLQQGENLFAGRKVHLGRWCVSAMGWGQDQETHHSSVLKTARTWKHQKLTKSCSPVKSVPVDSHVCALCILPQLDTYYSYELN